MSGSPARTAEKIGGHSQQAASTKRTSFFSPCRTAGLAPPREAPTEASSAGMAIRIRTPLDEQLGHSPISAGTAAHLQGTASEEVALAFPYESLGENDDSSKGATIP